ncbi:MAG: RICIN domain-containing protein [Catenulispora sp.]|nr:RICIN domain-containing protein [Catenulispora sp.]
MEKLRTLYYFTSAEESRAALPGSQAGVADLFSFDQDNHRWYPAAYWFWNLRGQVAANIGAGASALNTPLYNLYTSNLANIQAWTTKYMGGRSGICVPETMRFNGNGFQDDGSPFSDASCDQGNPPGPTWNGETVSTGAEIGLWVWQQYQTTGDLSFLRQNYPLMQQECVFLLAYTTVGSDGLRHAVANAHENQWDVQDPVNLIDAMKALFPATISAAQALGTDGTLVSQLQTAQNQIPDFPRTDASTHQQLLTASADASGTDVLGQSSQPTASVHNSEDDDLEAVWPYNLIGDSSPLLALAQRTYTHRVNTLANDWSFDAVQAARLGLPAEVAADLTALTKHYQTHPDGLGDLWGNTSGSSDTYIEQEANVALAVNEALVQDYDGILRIAPALPSGWDADGTAFIHGGGTVSVQVHGGVIGTVGIHAGSTAGITVRNPWPGQSVEVVDGGDESTVIVSPTTAAQLTIPATAGRTYLVQPVAAPVSALPYAPLTGTPATTPSVLGGNATLGTAKAGLAGTHVLSIAGEALDDPGASTGNVQLITWQINGGRNQNWILTAQSDGSYELKNGSSGLCADDYGGQTTAGTQVIQYQCTGHSNQHWIATLLANGAYTFKNVNSGLLLTTASTANGALVTQQADTGSALQRWSVG